MKNTFITLLILVGVGMFIAGYFVGDITSNTKPIPTQQESSWSSIVEMSRAVAYMEVEASMVYDNNGNLDIVASSKNLKTLAEKYIKEIEKEEAKHGCSENSIKTKEAFKDAINILAR